MNDRAIADIRHDLSVAELKLRAAIVLLNTSKNRARRGENVASDLRLDNILCRHYYFAVKALRLELRDAEAIDNRAIANYTARIESDYAMAS